MSSIDIPDTVRLLLSQRERISSGEVAAAAGVTRQAAHYHLARMVASGEISREGAGRGARYRREAAFSHSYPLEGLEEDRVWKQVLVRVPAIAEATEGARSILGHAFTEMLNNAVDHSGGTAARVTWWTRTTRIAFEVVDDGVGVFHHLRARLKLPDDDAAIQELMKGKQTTDPDAHAGEGIFFTSRMVELFELDSWGTRWIVDNARMDHAIGNSPPVRGTRVRCEVDRATTSTPRDAFERFADEDLEFSRSSVRVALFQTGGAFVTRAEAKRLAHRLESFSEVELDFSGVEQIGQGFADELFRVWAERHPDTRLIPTNMAPFVERMIRRARSRAPDPPERDRR